MAKVIFESWQEGLQKVTLSKLQIEMLGKSLSESKSNVDLLLDENIITIHIDDVELAKKFYFEVNRIGVNAKLIE